MRKVGNVFNVVAQEDQAGIEALNSPALPIEG